MATHSSIFAWRIPQTEEPGRAQDCKEFNMTEVTENACWISLLRCWRVKILKKAQIFIGSFMRKADPKLDLDEGVRSANGSVKGLLVEEASTSMGVQWAALGMFWGTPLEVWIHIGWSQEFLVTAYALQT